MEDGRCFGEPLHTSELHPRTLPPSDPEWSGFGHVPSSSFLQLRMGLSYLCGSSIERKMASVSVLFSLCHLGAELDRILL